MSVDNCRCTATSANGVQCTNQVPRPQRGRPGRLCDPCRKALQAKPIRQPGKPNLPPAYQPHPRFAWKGRKVMIRF